MTEKEIKRSAHRIRKQYQSFSSFKKLTEIAKEEGYVVIEFRRFNNTQDVETVIENLNLYDATNRERGFVYSDTNWRLIFIYADLTENEKRIILLHELCHIWLGHLGTSNILGLDVQQEYEANELCHYLMNPGFSEKNAAWIRRHKKSMSICLSVALVLICTFLGWKHYQKQQTYYGEYYVTENGTKYHLKNCMTIHGSKIRRLTKDDIDTGKYEPCGVCLPQQ